MGATKEEILEALKNKELNALDLGFIAMDNGFDLSQTKQGKETLNAFSSKTNTQATEIESLKNQLEEFERKKQEQADADKTYETRFNELTTSSKSVMDDMQAQLNDRNQTIEAIQKREKESIDGLTDDIMKPWSEDDKALIIDSGLEGQAKLNLARKLNDKFGTGKSFSNPGSSLPAGGGADDEFRNYKPHPYWDTEAYLSIQRVQHPGKADRDLLYLHKYGKFPEKKKEE